jgi:hypothetical protein
MSKILICGFPHCGTTILKSIIGHIDEVDEMINEATIIERTTDKKYILCKTPFTLQKYFEDKYKDYIKIFIVRNPLFVFSSLNKRFNYKPSRGHTITDYIHTIKLFIELEKNPRDNVYTIRYEDLFPNHFEKLRTILDSIGFNYTDDIFDNTKYKNEAHSGTKLVTNKPSNIHHSVYRTWQINQPFVSNNEPSKIDLLEEQRNELINNTHILTIYPEIKN